MNETKKCACCGAKMVEYPHTLSKGLVRAFAKTVKRFAPKRQFSFSECDLSYSQASNLQKLKYWGLLQKSDIQKEKGGEWNITDLGIEFVTGTVALPSKVWTYRGNVQRFEGKEVYIQDITGGWQYRPEYASGASPHQCSGII